MKNMKKLAETPLVQMPAVVQASGEEVLAPADQPGGQSERGGGGGGGGGGGSGNNSGLNSLLLGQLSQQYANLNEAIMSINAVMRDLKNQSKFVMKRLEDKVEIADLSAHQFDLRSHIDDSRRNRDRLEAKTVANEATAKAILETLGKEEERLSGCIERFTEVVHRDHLIESLAGVKETTDSLENEIGKNKVEFHRKLQEIDTAHTSKEQFLERNILVLTTQLPDVSPAQQAKVFEGQIEAIKAEVASLQSGVSGNTDSIIDVEVDVGKIKSKMKEVNQKVAKVVMTEDFEVLAVKLDSFKKDFQRKVKDKASNTALHAANVEVKNLHEEVLKLVKDSGDCRGELAGARGDMQKQASNLMAEVNRLEDKLDAKAGEGSLKELRDQLLEKISQDKAEMVETVETVSRKVVVAMANDSEGEEGAEKPASRGSGDREGSPGHHHRLHHHEVEAVQNKISDINRRMSVSEDRLRRLDVSHREDRELTNKLRDDVGRDLTPRVKILEEKEESLAKNYLTMTFTLAIQRRAKNKRADQLETTLNRLEGAINTKADEEKMWYAIDEKADLSKFEELSTQLSQCKQRLSSSEQKLLTADGVNTKLERMIKARCTVIQPGYGKAEDKGLVDHTAVLLDALGSLPVRFEHVQRVCQDLAIAFEREKANQNPAAVMQLVEDGLDVHLRGLWKQIRANDDTVRKFDGRIQGVTEIVEVVSGCKIPIPGDNPASTGGHRVLLGGGTNPAWEKQKQAIAQQVLERQTQLAQLLQQQQALADQSPSREQQHLQSQITSLRGEVDSLKKEHERLGGPDPAGPNSNRIPTPPQGPGGPSNRPKAAAFLTGTEVRDTMAPLLPQPPSVRPKADAMDVARLSAKVEELISATSQDKEELLWKLDQVCDVVGSKAEASQVELKIDRDDVYDMLDAIVELEYKKLSSDGETFISSNQLVKEEAGKEAGAQACLSCKRPLDALARTLAEVVAHQRFHHTHGSLRTTNKPTAVEKALQEVEEMKGLDKEKGKVNVTRTVLPYMDVYNPRFYSLYR